MKSKMMKKAQTEIPDQEAALVDRRFWTVRIMPGGPVVLGEHLHPGTIVMKNHGPGSIMVYTDYASIDVVLHSGEVRLLPTRRKIQVATTEGKPALVEFEYMLAVK
jgi:hypothetical protein